MSHAPRPLPRRRFLQSAAITGTGIACALGAGKMAVEADAVRGGASPRPLEVDIPADVPFAHGVASGDPLADSVILWTRVTPSVEALPGSGVGVPVTVAWQVSEDEDFTRVVAAGTAHTSAAVDHTVHVDARGLAPARVYYYRFIIDDGAFAGAVSPTGRTWTAPSPGAPLDSLRLAVASCANWESGFFSAYRDMAERARGGEIDVVVFLGDYIYEFARGDYPGKTGVTRHHEPAEELTDLTAYRIRHGHYRTDPDLRAAHAACPWVVVWDDHELANDAWRDGADAHHEGAHGPWPERRDAAMQAYFEWLPIRATSPSREGHLYRSLTFGDLVELTMMDLRTYRDQPPGYRGLAAAREEATMLGAEQFDWVRGVLDRSHTRWNVMGNSVMIAPLDLAEVRRDDATAVVAEFLGARSAAGVPMNLDQWDGYAAERDRLLRELAEDHTPVLFLTGDIHSEWANSITCEGREIGAELVCSSVSAPNVDDKLRMPAHSPFSRAAEARLRAANPDVRHVDLDSHGYAVATITPEAVAMTWLRVDNVEAPGSPVNPGMSLTWRPDLGFLPGMTPQ
ncbi:hypothetical protein CFRA_08590 [Corynebacterium frankenforstense DSM 45800]|uniref:Phosphodiesterase n=1 Tax=Corynebacterium frankenforstense DSM 45800 TaxID=1437875 RepID=A0A1L7CTV4_9CORY|nr:alkaline phosphatase D family protein [Corynebacterium frankenforstense]APT89295.1 hypothetical protein CFRA_08590 [Corynebacterium frankenforstense DSM 45800]